MEVVIVSPLGLDTDVSQFLKETTKIIVTITEKESVLPWA